MANEELLARMDAAIAEKSLLKHPFYQDWQPGTQAVVQKFREICGDRPVAEAVAALYAYESQVPEIATTKIDGLKKFYGVTQPEGLEYFAVHEETDKAHRAAWRGWLEEHASGGEEEILKTTNEALDALWGALDAVHCQKQEVRM